MRTKNNDGGKEDEDEDIDDVDQEFSTSGTCTPRRTFAYLTRERLGALDVDHDFADDEHEEDVDDDDDDDDDSDDDHGDGLPYDIDNDADTNITGHDGRKDEGDDKKNNAKIY
ncbi:hypothetical protein FHG87_003049 [Trinorchestia longiramus]|nr:hypothetical protein FHG87_003049 [Trinorchestia longiramus]